MKFDGTWMTTTSYSKDSIRGQLNDALTYLIKSRRHSRRQGLVILYNLSLLLCFTETARIFLSITELRLSSFIYAKRKRRFHSITLDKSRLLFSSDQLTNRKSKLSPIYPTQFPCTINWQPISCHSGVIFAETSEPETNEPETRWTAFSWLLI